jgi:hypothetical protein
LVERRKENDFCLASVVNQYSCDIPFVNVHCDYHCVYVRERYKLDVSFSEGYGHMRALCSHDGAFDHHVIYLTVVLSLLSFIFEIQVGASNDCVDGSEG